MSPFCISEICLDSIPESCRCKPPSPYQLSHPSPYLSHSILNDSTAAAHFSGEGNVAIWLIRMSTSHCPALFPSLFRICDRGVGIRTGVCLRDGKVCGRMLRYRGLSPLNSPNGGGGSVHYYRLSAVSARQCSEADPPPLPPPPPAIHLSRVLGHLQTFCNDGYTSRWKQGIQWCSKQLISDSVWGRPGDLVLFLFYLSYTCGTGSVAEC